MKPEFYLKKAKEISAKSDHHSHKIGCVIVRRNKIIGSGFNLMKTHPKSPNHYKNIHAEFMGVVNARFDVKNATAYVFRQQKNGTWALARPCVSCRNFLIRCGIVEIVYSIEGSYKGEKLK